MPEDIPTDIRLTERQGTRINDVGDFDTVTNQDYIRQSVAIDIIRTFGIARGEPLTPERIEDYRTEIVRALDDNEYVDRPFDVSLIDVRDDTLVFDIRTGEFELEITV